MLEQIGATIIGGIALIVLGWAWRRFSGDRIQIQTAVEQGPTSRELGFTEPAVKITVINKSESEIEIKDIRLMFCRAFGASVVPEAPPGRSHPELPVRLNSGAEENWYIPAAQLSELLRSLHRPRSSTRTAEGTLKLFARCITGTDRICKSPAFKFPKDRNAHWRGL